MTIGPQHVAVVRNETLVSMAINALVPTAILYAIGVAPPATLLGLGQLVHGMSMASGLATAAMTLAVTLIVRGRLRQGRQLVLDVRDVPRFARWLSSSLALRALTMGLVSAILLVPLGTAVAALSGILPLSPGEFVWFNLAYGTIVGLTMTPAVVLRALADRTSVR